jgi:hypothetical protein
LFTNTFGRWLSKGNTRPQIALGLVATSTLAFLLATGENRTRRGAFAAFRFLSEVKMKGAGREQARYEERNNNETHQ